MWGICVLPSSGKAFKRIARFAGYKVIGDIHLGDWGLQMGLIITELQERKPELPYFDESYTGDYPQELPHNRRTGGNLSYGQRQIQRGSVLQGKGHGKYLQAPRMG